MRGGFTGLVELAAAFRVGGGGGRDIGLGPLLVVPWGGTRLEPDGFEDAADGKEAFGFEDEVEF